MKFQNLLFFLAPNFKDFVTFIRKSFISAAEDRVKFWTLYHENPPRKIYVNVTLEGQEG
jgi:hypothetical protein